MRTLFGVLAGLALLVLASPAAAATINVTTTTDEFDSGSRCSIREAIGAANTASIAKAPGCVAGSGADTIIVPAGRHRLTRQAKSPDPPTATSENADVYGDLDVTQPVTIVHGGIRPAIIDSN